MDEIIRLCHPNIRPYVQPLYTYEFGLMSYTIGLDHIQSGKIVVENADANGDRFQIKLPYCKKNLIWQIVMNGDDVYEPPDFIMEDDFLYNATVELIADKVPSLANWNPSDAKCLLNVVLELLNLYKEYQVSLLSPNSGLHRYLFEYETLISMTHVTHDDVEVCVQNQNRSVVVTFSIRINVDFSSLPQTMPAKDQTLAVLLVEFKDDTKTQSQLILRHQVEEAIGHFTIQPLPSGASLMDYVPNVAEALQNKISQVVEGINQRKLFYCCLVHHLEPAILNGDSINFKDISFLLENKGFHFILSIQIPLSFPKDRPRVTLHSINSSKKVEKFDTYPYNSSWSYDVMVRNIFVFVRDVASKYLKNSSFE